ncbi:MAG TPA: S49 family peptidase, partial [Opitutaceae bacterium]
VVNGRKLDRAKVEEIAQGRVWSGAEAQKIGLVDEMGGLADAIRYAAKKANLGDKYRLSEYPKRMEFAEALAEAMQGNHPFTTRSSNGLIGKLTSELTEQARILEQFNAPTGMYARMPSQLLIK